MQDEAPPHFGFAVPAWINCHFIVGGLGVGNHQTGLHEVQVLIHVICFV